MLNNKLKLIAVDTRNGETSYTLLACTELCGLRLWTYEAVSRHHSADVIRDVGKSEA